MMAGSLKLISFAFGALLLFSAPCCHNSQHKGLSGEKRSSNSITIHLLPYDNFDTALASFIQKEISGFYKCSVKILPAIPLPQAAWYAPRSRYKADSLLIFQQALGNGTVIIAGLTNKDISTAEGTNPDWGVFGLGQCSGNACVISTYRLKKISKSLTQLQQRVVKVVLHELGHNFGLTHCTQSVVCLMADAKGTIAQVDREQKSLCNYCYNKISLK